MTRINSAIPVFLLTDEHLLAEHREIKRLPSVFVKSLEIGSINKIPKNFSLGTGHVLFFVDKPAFTLWRYKEIHNECLRRGFKVEDYSSNWEVYSEESNQKYFNNIYVPSDYDKTLLINRITERIQSSSKVYFHYEGKGITKEQSIYLITK